MPTSRYGLSCGRRTEPASGTAVAVAAGGYNIAEGGGTLGTTEFFYLATEEWTTYVYDLPTPLQDATAVQVRS